MKPLRLLFRAILLLAGVVLFWRWLSRHTAIPCPAWLSGLVEGPLMDRLLGTRTTLERIGLRPGQRVLEIGPGPGRLLVRAARRVLPGGEVFGLELQQGMIDKLKQQAAAAGVTNLSILHGDAAQSHFPPGHFDLIYFSFVLGEIPFREAALRQCYAALKPGGRLSITEFFPDPHYQPAGTVKRLAEEAGFRLEEIHGRWYFFTANFVK